MRLAIIATHPIQYQVPWFQRLVSAPTLEVKVFYAMMPDSKQQGSGFDEAFEWDIPLLNGYEWELLNNVASRPSLGSFRGCSAPDIGQALRKWRPDVALITGWNSRYLLQALRACWLARIPTLVRGDSNDLAPRGVLKRLLQRFLLRRYTGFLAVGKLNRAFYRNAGVAAERIFFCPHVVDNERFGAQARRFRQQRVQLRRQWSVPDDAVCYLFAGKLIEKKRVMDFLLALHKARDAEKKVCGLVVGTGAQRQGAQEFASSHNIPVSFAGFLNQGEIASAYAASDCLVLPSDFGETWGLVVNEAMACELPAIVSDRVGCGPDLVEPDLTGAIYPFADTDALARIMRTFGGSPQNLCALGKNARLRLLSNYTIDKAVAGTLQAIEYVSAMDRRDNNT